MKHVYTCITCSVTFQDSEIQREHYKCDWHRYNLLRKVEELAPIALDVFEERKKALDHQVKLMNGEEKEERGAYCSCCRKTFLTEASHSNHLKSKKHKDAEFKSRSNPVRTTNNNNNILRNNKHEKSQRKQETLAMEKNDEDEDEEEEDEEDVDSDEWNSYIGSPTECFFCSQSFSSLEKNLKHLTDKHSFFIPDIEYLIDLEGLLSYLNLKVNQGHTCLWCCEKGKEFNSVASVQKHMYNKGHCKMLFEGTSLAEYADFYDYSTSYPEGENENPDEEVEVSSIDDTGYELILPSGASIGHRSLLRYYRQHLNPNRSMTFHRSTVDKVIKHYKAIGWTGLSSSEAKRKAKDIKYMRDAQQKFCMKLGVRANKLQKYRRDPTIVFG